MRFNFPLLRSWLVVALLGCLAFAGRRAPHWRWLALVVLLWPTATYAVGLAESAPTSSLDLMPFLTVSGLAALLLLIVQFLVKPAVPIAYKALIPWIAVGLGIALAPLAGVGLGITGSAPLVALGFTGLLAGLTAVGAYQATLNNLSSANK